MKPKKEHKIREWLDFYKEDDSEYYFIRRIYYYFSDLDLSIDFLREIVTWLNDKQRNGLENMILYDWEKGIPVGDSFVTNCTTYVKNGLVKYVEKLKEIWR